MADRTGRIRFFRVMGLGVVEEFVIGFCRVFIPVNAETAIIEGLLDEPIELIQLFHGFPF
jgi:hypothetical protein